eukprot:3143993-Prymnesium_polylepis.2
MGGVGVSRTAGARPQARASVEDEVGPPEVGPALVGNGIGLGGGGYGLYFVGSVGRYTACRR